MEYYGNLDVSAYSQMAYLSHHGILGQKWGKKLGPPYPLGSGSHSSSETKAAKSAGITVGGSSGTYSGKKTKPSLIETIKQNSAKKKAEEEKKKAEEEKKKAEEEAAKTTRRSNALKRLRGEGKGFDGDDDENFLDDLADRYDKKDRNENIDKMISSMKDLGYSDKDSERELNKRYSKEELSEYESYKAEKQASSKSDRPSQNTQQWNPREQAKKDAIASANPSNIQKYVSDMSSDELRDALNRVNNYNQIKANIPKQKTALDKVEDAVNTINRVTTTASKAVDSYNFIAQFSNAVLDTKIPTLNIKGNNGNKGEGNKGQAGAQNKQKQNKTASDTIHKAFTDAGVDKMVNEEAFEKAVNDAADAWVNSDKDKKK